MQRSPLIVVCLLLAMAAAPLAGGIGLMEKALGGGHCGGSNCCCRAAAGGDCCDSDEGRPQLVSGCRCGHPDDGGTSVAPAMPRLCNVQAARLPDLCFTGSSTELTPGVLTRQPPAPEPPPPRDQD